MPWFECTLIGLAILIKLVDEARLFNPGSLSSISILDLFGVGSCVDFVTLDKILMLNFEFLTLIVELSKNTESDEFVLEKHAEKYLYINMHI